MPDSQRFEQILSGIDTKYIRARQVYVKHAVHIAEFSERSDLLLLVEREGIGFGGRKRVEPGEVLFIPQESNIALKFGNGKRIHVEHANRSIFKEEFFCKEQCGNARLSIVALDVKLYNSFDLYKTLNATPFVLHTSGRIGRLIKDIIRERAAEGLGYRHNLDLLGSQLNLELLRHIFKEGLFEKELKNQKLYFNDPRLLAVFGYIKQNLNGDLSNSKLADVTNVSEEYFGQLFKKTTGINAQKYVETQRLEMAVDILRSTVKSINQIADELGFKDTAYFCRRFKSHYGLSARQMRKKEADETPISLV